MNPLHGGASALGGLFSSEGRGIYDDHSSIGTRPRGGISGTSAFQVPLVAPGQAQAPHLSSADEDDLIYDTITKKVNNDPFRYTSNYDYNYAVHPLPHWMESDLGLVDKDPDSAGAATSTSSSSIINSSNIATVAAQQQVSQMAQTIGEQCTEIEKLKFELAKAKLHIGQMEKSYQRLLKSVSNSQPASNATATDSTDWISSYRTEPTIASAATTSAAWSNASPFRSESPIVKHSPVVQPPLKVNWNKDLDTNWVAFDAAQKSSPFVPPANAPQKPQSIDEKPSIQLQLDNDFPLLQMQPPVLKPTPAPRQQFSPRLSPRLSPQPQPQRQSQPQPPPPQPQPQRQSQSQQQPQPPSQSQPKTQSQPQPQSQPKPSSPPAAPPPPKQQQQQPTTPEVDKTEIYYPINKYNEPLNYRRLLERTVSCNWKLIVDRIVLDNDQQASIFLQQKLKIANNEQKIGIINAIIDQSFMLMVNRFGNFLVQRCLEYGTTQQIAGVTKGMAGHIVELAMDPFGCHVIQKALDCVDSDMKNQIIEEMLQSVNESVVHRYACHVWQKLFELRWDCDTNTNSITNTPPKFMQQVNKYLKGMWTQVALGETGSLVVQNIFENCLEHDKKPCIDEVIDNLDTIIRGQWGNWVIQHMVEHADEPYRQTVIDKIIYNSPIYSIDQFASKVVEKMLKMGDPVIIQDFLDKVTEPVLDRPRIPLIDIASDAHGNYLIQYILQSGSQAQKDQVAIQIKKHMVSLRGSKWGSKCAWLIDKNNRSKNGGNPKK